MPTSPARPPSGTTGPLAGGGNASAPPELASDGAAMVPSRAATAKTPASTAASILVASAGPDPPAGLRRSHLRPASASAAAAPTRAAISGEKRPEWHENQGGDHAGDHDQGEQSRRGPRIQADQGPHRLGVLPPGDPGACHVQ